MSLNYLEAKNLYKSYKNRRVVNGVNLRVDSGQVVGLLGPNGAGKTTSFYMIIGLIDVDGGAIKLNNNTLTHLPMHKRAQHGIGYLPQEPSVFRKLSVADNIMAILETRQDMTRSQRKERLEQLLDEFHLKPIRQTLGISLSGGERRRVEIARALSTDPKFILLDEPFAGVDPISVQDIKQQIQYLAEKGIGILITDHNVRETLSTCHTAYIISEGQVIANGTPDKVMNSQTVKDVYLGEYFSL